MSLSSILSVFVFAKRVSVMSHRIWRWWAVGLAFLVLLALAAVAPDIVAAAEEGAAEKPEIESGLSWFIRCSGWIGAIILLISIYFVATIFRLFMDMRVEMAVPEDLIGRCAEMVQGRNFQGVYDAAREDDSYLGRVLTQGISELPNGLSDAREAMERASEVETADLEKKISMLAVIGTLGPMIGLVGTLKGMIASFSVIARSDTAIRSSEVAGGISEALLLTFEGVALSVPAIYFFTFFRNRVAAISSKAMLTADQLLRHLFRAGRGKGGAAAPAAAPVAAAPAKPRPATFEAR
jgi:biopolymer transport protein ExbB